MSDIDYFAMFLVNMLIGEALGRGTITVFLVVAGVLAFPDSDVLWFIWFIPMMTKILSYFKAVF